MNILFYKDYYRMTGRKYHGIKGWIKMMYSHQIRYMYLWRKYQNSKGIVTLLKLKLYSRKYGLEISTNAIIGEGLYLGHPYNITVGNDVILGKNVNLHKGCTIGRENRGKREGSPQIGNDVYVGINATVIGNVKIGNDVMIAPNSFVNFDVPSHAVVIGNPGIVHLKENATKGYIAYKN